MLTGDRAETASVISEEVGVSSYEAEVKPDEKAAFVKKLQRNGSNVAMVGDCLLYTSPSPRDRG